MITCHADCGETFDSLQYVSNYELYGLKYNLVQDLATSSQIEAHPYLYTHNSNIAGYFFTILEILGFKSIWVKQLFTLMIFGLGLFFVYLSVSQYTNSRLTGLITLLLFCSDYEHILTFSLNSLRSWHWFALFGLVFYIKPIIDSHKTRGLINTRIFLQFLLFACITFLIGYDFWITGIFLVLSFFIFFSERPLFAKSTLINMFVVCFLLVTPFIIRQFQIISVLGIDFWIKDIFYSAAIKTSFLNHIFPITNINDIDKFYELNNVLRPPATQAQSIQQNLFTLRDMLLNIGIPTYGSFSFIIGFISCLFSIFLSICSIIFRNKNFIVDLQKGSKFLINLDSIKFYAAICLGICLGIAFFSPLSLHIYIKHEFPLIAAIFLIPKAYIVSSFVHYLIKGNNPFSKINKKQILASICIVLVVIDHLLVQYDNFNAKKPIDISWIDTIKDMKGETFAVSWIPSSVSVFTHTWAVGIKSDKQDDAFRRIENGGTFQREDFLLFGEQDADTDLQKYLSPSFWLYFPTEQLSYFDSPVPVCRQDYLLKFIHGLLPFSEPKPIPLLGIFPQPIKPGGQLYLVGRIDGETNNVNNIYVYHDDLELGELSYNCIYNIYEGIINLPNGIYEDRYSLVVKAIYRNDKTFIISKANIDISNETTSIEALPKIRYPQKSVDQVISNYPNLKIYKKGLNYVIFDLRK